MKRIAMLIAVVVTMMGAASLAHADWVRGYVRSSGTYVAPYLRSAPDGIPYNNYSFGR